MQKEFGIQSLQLADLPAAARIHIAAFEGHSLSLLGKEAVRRYYEWQLTGPHDVIALGVFDQAELVGFCIAGSFNGALSGFLKKNRTYLAVRLITHPWLLAHPIVMNRVILALRLISRYLTRQKLAAIPTRESAYPMHKSMGILSIAVHPAHVRQGAGTQLMGTVEALVLQRGFCSLDLSVDTHNFGAIQFYNHLGWQTTSAKGNGTGIMKKELQSYPGK